MGVQGFYRKLLILSGTMFLAGGVNGSAAYAMPDGLWRNQARMEKTSVLPSRETLKININQENFFACST